MYIAKGYLPTIPPFDQNPQYASFKKCIDVIIFQSNQA